MYMHQSSPLDFCVHCCHATHHTEKTEKLQQEKVKQILDGGGTVPGTTHETKK